jgi:hypothetical protein
MTTETAEAAPAEEISYQGYLIIEWPRRREAAPGFAHVMPGWKVSLTDAITGEQITTATAVEIHADAQNIVTAELTMFCDLDGKPVYGGSTFWPDDDGKPRTGTFSFLVAEMRVRL